MARGQEVEIKFRIENSSQLVRRLKKAGFRQETPRTHEFNTLYDLRGQPLRQQGALLRLREYGSRWVLTHKAKGKPGRHKSRAESETRVDDGKQMDAILRALGFSPTFRYEKFRAEWTDGKGHVVVDHTPIGNIGEIEGPSRWIDRTARQLEIPRRNYITQSYGEMFAAWKKKTGSDARDFLFSTVRQSRRGAPRS